jgi:hypothetical protein
MVDAVELIREREQKFMRFIRSRGFNLADAKAGRGTRSRLISFGHRERRVVTSGVTLPRRSTG